MAIVYQHRRLDTNEIFYVGIGRSEKRAYSKFGRNKYWYHIVDKHGYEVEITHIDIIWEEACSIEKYLISFYGRKDLNEGTLVNMTDGGDGANNVILTEEQKRKKAIDMIGEKNPMYNKKHSEETKQKISNKKIGISRPKFTEEHKQKLALAKKGKKRPDLSIRNAGNKGRKFKMSIVPTKQCPYCDKIGNSSNMIRWHFDNCKNKK